MPGNDQAKTKAQLYKYFAGKGPTRMMYTFLRDRGLQAAAIIIVEATAPIEDAYAKSLKTMQGGPVEQGTWAAKRAAGDWFRTVQDILRTPSKYSVLKRLRFTMEAANPADSFTWEEEEQATAELLVKFSHELAARYAWAFIPTSCNMPQAFAVYLLPDSEERARFVKRLKDDLLPVYEAEQHFKECVNKDLVKAAKMETVLSHVGWCYHQLPREILGRLIQCDFDPLNADCRQLCAKLYRGSGTTKHCLEDTFAHLQGMSHAASNNRKMSHFARLFYASTARCVASGGIRTIIPDKEDWDAYMKEGVDFGHLKEIFDSGSSSMPEPESADSVLVPKPEGMQAGGWKAAGPESNQRGAAAVAYLGMDQTDNWSHIDKCWAGRFVCWVWKGVRFQAQVRFLGYGSTLTSAGQAGLFVGFGRA